MLANEVLLLKIIKSKSRISLLCDRGLSYSQVAILIKNQENDGNIVVSDVGIHLTSKGQKILEEEISKSVPKTKDQWILPQEHLYKEPIPFDKIVLPKNKKI